MPEGDTVHKLAAMLGAALRGRTICRVDSRAQLAAVLSGRSLSGVDARGKHLFLRFDGGPALRVHLGLYGSWHRYPVGEPWKKPQRHAGLVLHTDTEVLVCFNPKEVQLIRDGGLIERDLAARLGPDLVDAGVDPARWDPLESTCRHASLSIL